MMRSGVVIWVRVEWGGGVVVVWCSGFVQWKEVTVERGV